MRLKVAFLGWYRKNFDQWIYWTIYPIFDAIFSNYIWWGCHQNRHLSIEEKFHFDKPPNFSPFVKDLFLDYATIACYSYTMLQKISKCELKAWLCWIWSFYRHSDFTWNQILVNSNSPKMSFLAIWETLNFEFLVNLEHESC